MLLKVTRGKMIRGQWQAARALIGWSQSDLAEKVGVASLTIKRLEGGQTVSDDIRTRARAALEAGGVEFTNGDQPGVRMRNPKSEKLLDERKRAEIAKTLALEWTAYCKEHNSMAFASASGDLILIQFRKVGGMEVFNSMTVRVLDRGFELDGKIVDKDKMKRLVFAELETHPYRV
jgi:transcriptional regulator with XRE-family HTH domain